MRLAFHNPFSPDAPWAEKELSLRMIDAARAKGWDARALHTSDDIEDYGPDAVVCLHPEAAPKVTRFPSFACVWNPPSLYEGMASAQRHLLSFDGYLVCGPAMATRIADLFHDTAKPVLTAPIHPSSPATGFTPTLEARSRLFYVGSNWDGRRFPRVLERLGESGVLALHGAPDRWKHLKAGYVGPLPFDGRSVVRRANECGIGLCLHLPPHAASGLPNMRVFELCAAGALMIADRHPFIEAAFGDTVLYVDTAQDEDALAEQILGQVAWARENTAQGRAMAYAAQRLFIEHHSLERLFDALPELLRRTRAALGFDRHAGGDEPEVDAILPVTAGGGPGLERRLVGLAGQTLRPRRVIVAARADQRGVLATVRVPSALTGRLVHVDAPAGAADGSVLWSGLRMAAAPWIALVPEGTVPYPNHIESLVRTVTGTGASVAYSGALTLTGGGLKPLGAYEGERRVLRALEPFTARPPREAADAIDAGAVLFAAELLDKRLLKDPGLAAGAARYLLRRLADRAPFEPTWQVTAEIPDRDGPAEPERIAMLERLRPVPAPASEGAAASRRSARQWVTGATDPDPALAATVPVLAGVRDVARLEETRPVLVYGASRGGRLVQLEITKWDRLRIAGFLDSYTTGEAWGLPVRLPTAVPIEELRAATVVIASQYVSAIVRTLNAIGGVTMVNAFPLIAAYTDTADEPVASVTSAPTDAGPHS